MKLVASNEPLMGCEPLPGCLTDKRCIYARDTFFESFLIDGYEPEGKTVYQFHGCHWHEHACLKNCTKRQQKRYKDTCQIDWLIKNNGWDAKYKNVKN